MSLVLVLFAVALVITFAGLFLTPRSQPRSPRNEYLLTPKGRRIVESTPIPQRTHRVVNTGGSRVTDPPVEPGRTGARSVNIDPAPRRSRISASMRTDPVAQRARASNLNAGLVKQRAGAKVSSASVAYPDLLGGLQERLGSWKVAVPGLIAISLLGFYLLSTVFSHPLLWTAVSFGTPASAPTPAPGTTYTASQHLTRLGQLDPAEYQSTQEFNTWAYSACSAAAMTEVINSYGHAYRITTVLETESAIYEITPQEGLLEEVGI